MILELMPRRTVRDASGFGVFAHGDAGAAHVMAHRMLDEGRHELGHRLLGTWLDRNEGAGSDWTHLQWHMAVFEIAVGRWSAALDRFEREILPVASSSADALTDAPAMLWRLWLTRPADLELPWEPVRATALRNLRMHGPYVELHCLLALAGARDVEALDDWMLRIQGRPAETRVRLLEGFAVGLKAFAAADYRLAATVLTSCEPRIAELGGSGAQNLLFGEIAAHCRRQAGERAAA